MGNIPDHTVVCKCLNFIDIKDDDFLFDYRRPKLKLSRLIKLHLDAQLNRRTDLRNISDALRSNLKLQEVLDLESISHSQVNRATNDMPLEVTQALFLLVNSRLQRALGPATGIPEIGKLRIVDSTQLALPEIAGKWAQFKGQSNAVKIHTQVVVNDLDTLYPDKIICSSRGVADQEVALDLVVDDDAIHVLDRGYIVYAHYKQWIDRDIRFVARIQKRNKTTIHFERDVEKLKGVLRDADVTVTYKEEGRDVKVPLRLVEFTDDKGRFYRVLTNVWDLSSEKICEIYRHRWMIELFFKWMKQHLSFVHLYSYKPNAVWNQIYLALIAYMIVMLLKVEVKTKKSANDVLKLLQLYMEQSWETFIQALHRAPTKKSKGRKKKKKMGRPRKHPEKRRTIKIIVK